MRQTLLIALSLVSLPMMSCDDGSLPSTSADALRGVTDLGGADLELDDVGPAFIDMARPDLDARLMDAAPDAAQSECRSDPDCDDGLFCNGAERCSLGRCYASPISPCEDAVRCTIDRCDEPTQSCTSEPSDDACPMDHACDRKIGCYPIISCTEDVDCDDGSACNGLESCLMERCVPGRPIDCDDEVLCTVDVCVDETGDCENLPVHGRCVETELCSVNEGCIERPPCMRDDDCDDGSYCNGVETCDADSGACVPGVAPEVDDGVPCTIDVCSDQLAMVVHTPTPARCSDGLFCNGAETCHPIDGCQPGAPPNLSDGVGCTTDTCDEEADFIQHTADDAACGDGLFCNGEEVCHPIDGCQAGEPVEISDGVGCTVDACSEVEGRVTHQTDDTACDDRLFCNGVERCDPDLDCQAGAPPQIDDGVPCTIDTCDEQRDRVVHNPDNGLCDNDLFCDGRELCVAGQGCVDGPAPNLDDGVPCTVDACDEDRDRVTHLVDHARCDDDLFCNGREQCDAAAGCVDGPDPRIDDGLACTNDRCDEELDLVLHTPDNAACNDGLFCNGAETCDAAQGCLAGPRPPLDDGVSCTVDTCDEVNDIVIHTPNPAICDDGLFCNGDERCDRALDCVAGAPPVVDDGVDCTADRCDEALDIITHSPRDVTCDDGAFCNGQERCDGAQGCRPGAPPVVDDGVRCTQDRCDEESNQIIHLPVHELCDDGSFCNGDEFCDLTLGCLDGESPADGSVCRPDPRGICLDQQCDLSFCGDGFIDAGAGEECEDGNANAGDGCSDLCRREENGGGDDDRYSGIFDVQPNVNWSCGFAGIPLVTVNVDTFGFLRAAGRLEVTTRPGPTPPTLSQRPAPEDGRFDVSARIGGGCAEIYRLEGRFEDDDLDRWTGRLHICFEGAQCAFTECNGCREFEVSGTRLRD